MEDRPVDPRDVGKKGGRRLHLGDPLIDEIQQLRAECEAAGVPYPSRKVDDYYAEHFVFFGRTPYATKDLAILRPTEALRNKPISLPPGFVFNGEDRLQGEGQAAYAHYLAYRDLGPERNILRASKACGATAHSRFATQAVRYYWSERAAAFDSHMEIEARKSAQIMLQEQMSVEVKRRATYLENEWAVVERGFEIVNEMLKYPVVEKKSERTDERGMTHITIWQPGKWTYSAMAQLIEALTKIGRLNSGLSTSNTSQKNEDLTDRSGGPDMPMNAEDEAMHRYASQKAEEAYFAACDEWKSRQQAPMRALVVA